MAFARTHTGGQKEQGWVLNLKFQSESPIEELRSWGQALGIRLNCMPGKGYPSISLYICSRKSLEFTVRVQTEKA